VNSPPEKNALGPRRSYLAWVGEQLRTAFALVGIFLIGGLVRSIWRRAFRWGSAACRGSACDGSVYGVEQAWLFLAVGSGRVAVWAIGNCFNEPLRARSHQYRFSSLVLKT